MFPLSTRKPLVLCSFLMTCTRLRGRSTITLRLILRPGLSLMVLIVCFSFPTCHRVPNDHHAESYDGTRASMASPFLTILKGCSTSAAVWLGLSYIHGCPWLERQERCGAYPATARMPAPMPEQPAALATPGRPEPTRRSGHDGDGPAPNANRGNRYLDELGAVEIGATPAAGGIIIVLDATEHTASGSRFHAPRSFVNTTGSQYVTGTTRQRNPYSTKCRLCFTAHFRFRLHQTHG